jgi:sec-independent protein translocase protein TatA
MRFKEIRMGSFSIWHLLIVLALALLLFGGGGKIPKLMKDLGQGITAFKRGLKEDGKPGEPGSDKAIEADAGHKDKAAG